MVTKDRLYEGNTFHAQGGMAVALSSDDTPKQHLKDTLKVGEGLCNEDAVKILVDEGPLRIKELINWGAEFDKDGETFSFTREGGHSVRRIIHAKGDATGGEVERILALKTKAHPGIRILERVFAIDLLSDGERCFGAIIQSERKGRIAILARTTVLATGGLGQIYRETTNSHVATGDGVAMAYRAGAVVVDMEFVQFHPTTLYVAGASRALISEVVRGEGGILRNKYGERFMERYHPLKELAPRDVLSRAIQEEMKRTEDPHVYLDLTHLDPEFLEKRFPKIAGICSSFGIDIRKDFIPVRPTSHYMIGGVKTDLWGRTSIKGLYACGEVASVGLHGANRLPSNSLPECLVFGYRAGVDAAKEAKKRPRKEPKFLNLFEEDGSRGLDIDDVRRSLKSLMWRDVGIEREEEKLLEAGKEIDFWSSYVMNREFSEKEGWELQNMLTIASLMTKAALMRKETRGVHCRIDYPKKNRRFRRHIELNLQSLNLYRGKG
jgi:L-aspartate oxidase